MDQKQIAETILQQMGGVGALRTMIGASQFTSLPGDDRIRGGLYFRIPGNLSRPRINRIRVGLTGADLYDVEFHYVSKARGRAGLTNKLVKQVTGVYNYQLKSTIESNTGLVLSVPRIRGLA